MRKKVSVAMATYNGEKYIEEQIKSILSQLHKNDELIISDDMSTDNTLNIIKKFNDSRIKIYIHNEDHGFVKNFENALLHVTGEYVFFADQDDIWVNDKVQKMTEALNKYDFVVSDCITVDEQGNIIDKSRFEYFNIKSGFWRVMFKNRYLGCCMAFNRKVLDVVLPFPKRTDLVEHDTWIASVAEKYFKVFLLKEPLIYYKRHGNNASDGGFNKGYSLFNKIYRRIYRLGKIIQVKKRRL